MKTLNEEMKKIKHLFNYKKGNYIMEQYKEEHQLSDIELDHNDSTHLYHLLNSHPKKHTFMDSLNHNVHAHLGPNNHLSLEFPHLGKHHNIEFDLEGSYPTSHGGHDEHGESHSDFGVLPHIVIGGGLKIPIKSFGKHH